MPFRLRLLFDVVSADARGALRSAASTPSSVCATCCPTASADRISGYAAGNTVTVLSSKLAARNQNSRSPSIPSQRTPQVTPRSPNRRPAPPPTRRHDRLNGRSPHNQHGIAGHRYLPRTVTTRLPISPLEKRSVTCVQTGNSRIAKLQPRKVAPTRSAATANAASRAALASSSVSVRSSARNRRARVSDFRPAPICGPV